MKTKKMTCLLSLVVAMAGSASIMAVLNTKNNLGRAAATGGAETVSIYFGTKTGSNSTIGSNTSSYNYYTVTDNGTGFAISSLSGITAAYRTRNSEYALRLGSTYYAGAVTFNFNASYVVTAAAITTMGLASTFQSFLEWGLTNYPAERTMVVMWDHGFYVINRFR